MFSRASLVAGLAFVAACSVQDPEGVFCGSDGNCAAGEVCAFGLCLDPSDQRLSTVDVEVVDTTGALPVQSVRVDLSQTSRVDVALRDGVIVAGSVVTNDDAALPDAFVLAKPSDESIEGRVLAPSAVTDADGNFTFVCIDGREYDVSVTSSSPLLPPLTLPRLIDATGESLRLDPIPLVPGAISVRGTVVVRDGVSELPVPGMSVKLTKELAAGGPRIQLSSVATTGADGRFEIAIAEDDVDMTLEIEPTIDNPGMPSLTTLVPAALKGPVDLGSIDLGAVTSPRSVSVRIIDVEQQPVPFAQLFLNGALGNGTYSAGFVAGEDGIVSAGIPPAETPYQAVVVGPAGSTGGLLFVESFDVAAPVEMVLTLPARVTYSGRVIDALGDARADAGISIVRLLNQQEPLPADTLLAGAATLAFETASDDRGAFTVQLDPGTYRVSTRPALGSNLPADSRVVEVGVDGLTQDINLDESAIVAGTVLFDGAAVGNAFIRVFSELVDESGAAILLGEGVADAAGTFEIVVPDRVTNVTNPDPPGPKGP